jgi:hypothetical protein
MPQSNIFFEYQTQCCNDCRPPVWRLSTKYYIQLLQNGRIETLIFRSLAVYYRGSDLMPQSNLFF